MFDPDRRHLVAYLAAAAVLVVIAMRLIGSAGREAPIPSVTAAAPARPAASRRAERPRTLIWIDVAGAVRRPGLYSLPAGSRVAAALERAGGALRRADTAAVNLAAKLVDGQQVLVPARGPGGAAAFAGGSPAGRVGGGTGTGGATGAAPSGANGAASAASAGLGPGARISLSTASPEQLEELDGIGPALAGRIVAYRQAHGGFRSIDQLQEVSGIGEKRFEAMRGSVAP
jgi:competence protein ComEA